MQIDWRRGEDGIYRADNGAATFEIEKVENTWYLEATRREGGLIFAQYYKLRDAKAKASAIACRAGWHRV